MRGTEIETGRPAMRSRMACSGCGTEVGPGEPYPFRCPTAGSNGDVDHVLVRVLATGAVSFPEDRTDAEANPFLRYRGLFRSNHLAAHFGLADAEYRGIVDLLDESVALVDGHGVRVTPLVREHDRPDGPQYPPDRDVWVKN